MFANSRDVAAYFHKQHRHVLEKFDALDCSEEFGQSNFRQTPYVEEQNGQTYRSIEMTRDGFAFVMRLASAHHSASAA